MNHPKTFFICGIYGVGKSTLCRNLSKATGIAQFSAGDLISDVNGEKYGVNKVVTDTNKNQDVLVERVTALIKTHPQIFLAGHFCIFNKNNGVEILPEEVFENLFIKKIVLLETDISVISKNLSQRDGIKYSDESLKSLQLYEHNQALQIAMKIGVPLFIYEMKFDDTDITEIIHFIND